eukprot:CAMPEP_0182496706 /NCGR_PEP_ID=MMETSP1321-20130603/5298_1 /TAXON_ID=91990 /ORGANISM="Bolidomonas sp., Strain RCC1657" /LENGTH=850 /DNA_ID=CAMNT_0024700373 /DNA_START=1165 /DNA_END=3714 /DNA_ORIENTATION=+
MSGFAGRGRGRGGQGRSSGPTGRGNTNVCFDYRNTGTCARGDNCRYAHEVGGGAQGGRGTGGRSSRQGNQGRGRNNHGRNKKNQYQQHRNDQYNQRNQTRAPQLSRQDANPWTPPQPELRTTKIEISPTTSYQLHFPLELTNKDYLRRIFECVGRGIKNAVVRVSESKNMYKFYIDQYSGDDNSNDVYYLLKQIVCKPGKPGSGAPSTPEEQLVHQTAYLSPGTQTNVNTLVVAAQHVLDKRNAISHFERDSSRKEDVTATFQAAKELLECFGTEAIYAFNELKALESQYLSHQVFKGQRVDDLGWEWDDTEGGGAGNGDDSNQAGSDGSDAHDVGVEELRVAHDALKSKVEAALEEREEARTSLVRLLIDTSEHVQKAQKRAGQAEDYNEAKRLKTLKEAIDGALASDGGYEEAPGGGFGPMRIQYMLSLIQENESLVAKWRNYQSRCTNEDAYDEAEDAKGKAEELLNLLTRARKVVSPVKIKDVSSNEVTALKVMTTKRDVGYCGINDTSYANGRSALELLHQANGTTGMGTLMRGWPEILRVTCSQFKEAGFTSTQAKEAGYNARECYEAGFGLRTDFTAQETANEGFNASELRRQGYMSAELKSNFKPNQVHDAGYNDMHKAFTALECKNDGFGISELKAFGYTCAEVREAGFGARACSDAGYKLSSGFAVAEVHQELGGRLAASAMKDFGFERWKLLDAGYNKDELKAAGFLDFTNESLKAAVNEWCRNSSAAEAKYGNIRDWDTSEVTSMERLFSNMYKFNGDVSSWDVSNVTTMEAMFCEAKAFNGDLSSWDVSNVTTMEQMFQFALAFNGDLSSWDVSNVTIMEWMFSWAKSFNRATIANW